VQRNDVTEPLSRRRFLQTTGAAADASLLAAVPDLAAQHAGEATLADSVSRRIHLHFRLNGKDVAAELEARVTLLDFLRERIALTATKKGCNEGACGACTVLLDGKRVNACLTLAASCEGAQVTTCEGLAGPDGKLHPVQAAFIEHDAFQCGYCTPGQVVSAVACIREGNANDAATVREWMSGNLCRCSAYPQITAAVLDAAKRGDA
jgi:xanthine dehydrogenase YagT iron-sulfur-binding subunit